MKNKENPGVRSALTFEPSQPLPNACHHGREADGSLLGCDGTAEVAAFRCRMTGRPPSVTLMPIYRMMFFSTKNDGCHQSEAFPADFSWYSPRDRNNSMMAF